MTVLLIPLAVQLWSTWYPGSEPGGGGYIAQRMLAARTEKDAMAATLWFNIAHYALRPWPWILVALASLIVYPSLSGIFPDRSGDLAGLLRQDQAGSLWLARRCRYRRGGSSARQRVRRAHRLVPRLCRCLCVAVPTGSPILRPLPIWVRLPCGCRRCRFQTLPHGSENWVLDVVTPRRHQEDWLVKHSPADIDQVQISEIGT